MVKFTILHPAFKLFLFGAFRSNFSQSISKINNPYFLSLGWSDDVFVFCAIIADTSFNGKALFFKIDILPCQSANFTDTKSRIVCYLDWQDCRWILYFEIFNQSLIIFCEIGCMPSSTSSSENKSTSSACFFSLIYCIGLKVIYCFGNTANRNDCCNTAEKNGCNLCCILFSLFHLEIATKCKQIEKCL